MNIEAIKQLAEQHLEGSDIFVVDCVSTPSNDITLTLDSDTHVTIDACVELSRIINEAFDRDEEDFSLTVTSAGIGEPLRLLRQYRKIIGSSVDVLLTDGVKILGTLDDANEEGITISYDEKVAVEGKKRKELQHTVRTYTFAQIKSVKEYLDYK
ncbi:MAG: ribosome assembly cofactor RimP [Alistipes sp.]|jgi:ribosome maturation factor RimP|nr:ribosome assembly cofactor RimP [Alistipes sp.]